MDQHNVRVNMLVVSLGRSSGVLRLLLRLFKCVLYPQYIIFLVAILSFHLLLVVFWGREPFSDFIEHELLI